MRGTVDEFDEQVGLGAVLADDGELYPFHCTQIGDGTRTIEVGTEVDFVVNEFRPKGPEAYSVKQR